MNDVKREIDSFHNALDLKTHADRLIESLNALSSAWRAAGRHTSSEPRIDGARGRLTNAQEAECLSACYFRKEIIEKLEPFTQRALAERYGVSKRTVEEVCQRRRGVRAWMVE